MMVGWLYQAKDDANGNGSTSGPLFTAFPLRFLRDWTEHGILSLAVATVPSTLLGRRQGDGLSGQFCALDGQPRAAFSDEAGYATVVTKFYSFGQSRIGRIIMDNKQIRATMYSPPPPEHKISAAAPFRAFA